MDKERSVKGMKKELQKLKHHIKWEDLEVDAVYHVPPIITIKRMDIIIVSKDDENVMFKEVGNSKKGETKMHKTSILSRFLVKKRKY